MLLASGRKLTNMELDYAWNPGGKRAALHAAVVVAQRLSAFFTKQSDNVVILVPLYRIVPDPSRLCARYIEHIWWRADVDLGPMYLAETEVRAEGEFHHVAANTNWRFA